MEKIRPNNSNAVSCAACKKLHLEENKTFISIYGNVYVGMDGGLIGNNLAEDGRVDRISIFCIDCFKSIFKEF